MNLHVSPFSSAPAKRTLGSQKFIHAAGNLVMTLEPPILTDEAQRRGVRYLGTRHQRESGDPTTHSALCGFSACASPTWPPPLQGNKDSRLPRHSIPSSLLPQLGRQPQQLQLTLNTGLNRAALLIHTQCFPMVNTIRYYTTRSWLNPQVTEELGSHRTNSKPQIVSCAGRLAPSVAQGSNAVPGHFGHFLLLGLQD